MRFSSAGRRGWSARPTRSSGRSRTRSREGVPSTRIPRTALSALGAPPMIENISVNTSIIANGWIIAQRMPRRDCLYRTLMRWALSVRSRFVEMRQPRQLGQRPEPGERRGLVVGDSAHTYLRDAARHHKRRDPPARGSSSRPMVTSAATPSQHRGADRSARDSLTGFVGAALTHSISQSLTHSQIGGRGDRGSLAREARPRAWRDSRLRPPRRRCSWRMSGDFRISTSPAAISASGIRLAAPRKPRSVP